MATLKFENEQITFDIPIGTEFTQACKANPKIPLKFGCQKGNCGVCLIKIEEGKKNLSPLTKQERETLDKLKRPLDGSYRLACQCALLGNATILS